MCCLCALGVSVPQSLGASVALVLRHSLHRCPRCLRALVPLCFGALCALESRCLDALSSKTLPASVLHCPWCSSAPRIGASESWCLDAPCIGALGLAAARRPSSALSAHTPSRRL
ncbi:UNVERIFIED_CONTAM: hypothetical protein FKN15_072081 [Acipenser sinensis]